MDKRVKEVNDGNFEQIVLQSEAPVLVDFWAEWCGPCRTLAPTVDAVAKKYTGNVLVAKLNVDDNPSVTQRYGVQGIPTLILFNHGEEKERIVGVVNKEEISRTLDKHLSAVSN